jgi:hypothetical protein
VATVQLALLRGAEESAQTMAVLGMAQDASGQVYVTGNQTGRPFGTGGFVLRIVPGRGR